MNKTPQVKKANKNQIQSLENTLTALLNDKYIERSSKTTLSNTTNLHKLLRMQKKKKERKKQHYRKQNIFQEKTTENRRTLQESLKKSLVTLLRNQLSQKQQRCLQEASGTIHSFFTNRYVLSTTVCARLQAVNRFQAFSTPEGWVQTHHNTGLRLKPEVHTSR